MDNLYILKTYGANGSVLYKFGYSSNMDKKMFTIGNRYSRKEIKEKLQELYNNLGIKRTAKYSDLSEVMSIKDVKVKGERFIEILGK